MRSHQAPKVWLSLQDSLSLICLVLIHPCLLLKQKSHFSGCTYSFRDWTVLKSFLITLISYKNKFYLVLQFDSAFTLRFRLLNSSKRPSEIVRKGLKLRVRLILRHIPTHFLENNYHFWGSLEMSPWKSLLPTHFSTQS